MAAASSMRRKMIKLINYTIVGSALGALSIYGYVRHRYWSLMHSRSAYVDPEDSKPIENSQIPDRVKQIEQLKKKKFDILVIGGGATGSGVTLDAVSRGLSVACIERADFSAGTSSRSTKLIHGGVRYLEKAIREFDLRQLDLVCDALRERRHLLSIAPHLSRSIPILVPFYHSFPSHLFYAPYYWAGVKAYDFFAGPSVLEPSYYISRREVLEKFPMLKRHNLKGGVVYFDGMHNDSRMNLGIALTAAAKGAVVANHIEVKNLIKDKQGKVCGAMVRDLLDGSEWTINAEMTVNATGPFSDSIRQMANPTLKPIVQPSSGVHVVLSNRYAPEQYGLILPETADGRVLFLLPWEGSVLAGTTDSSAIITALPRPHESEIQFIIKELSRFLNSEVRSGDVDAAWSGIRPLAHDPAAKDTQSIVRDHVIELTNPGMLTICGGKWTTYRLMAEQAVDRIIHEAKDRLSISAENIKPCHTTSFLLIGAAGFSLQVPTNIHRLGFDKDIADHLAHSYGDKSYEVVNIAKKHSLSNRLAYGYPFIEAEVVYSAKHEYAFTAIDVIAHRTRLAFLNSDAAKKALPRVISLLATVHKWDTARRVLEYQKALEYLKTMNRKGRKKELIEESDVIKLREAEERIRNIFVESPFSHNDIAKLKKQFDSFDKNMDGKISKNDLLQVVIHSKLFGAYGKLDSKNNESLPTQLRSFMNSLEEAQDESEKVDWEEFLFASAVYLSKHPKQQEK